MSATLLSQAELLRVLAGAAISAASAVYSGSVTASALIPTAKTELTIATGAIAVTQMFHTVDTEADAASDDLTTITGGALVPILFLQPANTARTVVLDHGVGANGIVCPGALDVPMADASDVAVLIFIGTGYSLIGFCTLAAVDAAFAAVTATTILATGNTTFGAVSRWQLQNVDMADAAHALVWTGAGAAQSNVVGNVILADPNSTGADETLTLPSAAGAVESSRTAMLWIMNPGGENVICNGVTIAPGKGAIFVSNGAGWATMLGA